MRIGAGDPPTADEDKQACARRRAASRSSEPPGRRRVSLERFRRKEGGSAGGTHTTPEAAFAAWPICAAELAGIASPSARSDDRSAYAPDLYVFTEGVNLGQGLPRR
jgi:hypothetical protein